MRALSRLPPGARILIIGSGESTFSLSAASLGYKVTAIDPRPPAHGHPNLESHATVVEDWDGPAGSFAAAFLISTLTHAGIASHRERPYRGPGQKLTVQADVLARVRHLLSPDGLVVLTIPYGSRERIDFVVSHDEYSLTKLLADWEILDRRIAVRRDAITWTTGEDARPGNGGVVMVMASPKRTNHATSSQL
jgi:hypothetical protein